VLRIYGSHTLSGFFIWHTYAGRPHRYIRGSPVFYYDYRYYVVGWIYGFSIMNKITTFDDDQVNNLGKKPRTLGTLSLSSTKDTWQQIVGSNKLIGNITLA